MNTIFSKMSFYALVYVQFFLATVSFVVQNELQIDRHKFSLEILLKQHNDTKTRLYTTDTNKIMVVGTVSSAGLPPGWQEVHAEGQVYYW